MRIQGNAPSGTTGETAETAASTEAQSAPPAEGQVVRSPDGQVQLPASGTRMDIQSRLLEASAPPEVSAVAGSTGVGSIDAPSGAGEHAELRAAFDRIDKPSGIASTYRIDSNNDAFASRWKTLEGATKTFDTTYFIWEKDIFGMAYLGHMLKKANDGVAIRGMMDATGDAAGTKGFKATFRGQDYLQELVGVDPDRVQIGIFNPLLKKDFSSLKGIVASNHDKLAIADGDTLETGGRNMAAHYYSDPDDHGGVYRDTDIHIENTTVAGQATDAFEAEFNSNVTEMIKPELLANFSPKDIQLLGTHAMMDQWLKAEPLSDAQVTEIRELHHEGKPMPKHMIDDVVAKAVAALPGLGIDRQPSGDDMTMLREMASQLISNPSLRGDYNSFNPTSIEGEVKIIDNTSHSSGGVNEISPALLDIIDSAQESIYIHNPYVVLTDTALNKLAEAGERGVKIVFGTNSPESTDSAVTQAYFQEDWPLILARVPNSQIMVATGDQKHHAKSFVIDGVLTGVSTYNADWLRRDDGRPSP
jgi:phosphatidylserine/phosphatidylglycerophosphate/cardiolipin synthase-like enzyme